MKKLDGVVDVHPHGDRHMAMILAAKADAVDRKKVEKALAKKKYKLKGFQKVEL